MVKFKSIYDRLFEAGIVLKWEKYYKFIDQQDVNEFNARQYDGPMPIRRQDFFGAWIIFFIGLGLSLLVFGIEKNCSKLLGKSENFPEIIFVKSNKQLPTLVIQRYMRDVRRYSFSALHWGVKHNFDRKFSI